MMTLVNAPATSAPGTSVAGRGRGRPREFDRDEVIEKAMSLFWEKGFEATSMADIVEVTGLNKSSIYNAFGSKDELFTLILDRYLEQRVGMVTQLLTEGSAGLADVELFLAYVREEAFGKGGRMGCLAVNTSTELACTNEAMSEMSVGFRDDMRAALRAALTRAETAGEIEKGTVERDVAILLAFMLSLPVITRSGASPAELEGQFAAIEALLVDWRRHPVG